MCGVQCGVLCAVAAHKPADVPAAVQLTLAVFKFCHMCSEHIREPAVSPDQGADVVKGDVQAPEQADLPQGLQIGVRVISVAVLIPGRDEKSFGFIKAYIGACHS